MKTSVVYLIHFFAPYRHARHYLGSTADLDARLAEHQRGAGARLMEVIASAGINWTCARAWSGDRRTERMLKQRKDACALCPLCRRERRARQRQRRREGRGH